jgi:hypothetical protein
MTLMSALVDAFGTNDLASLWGSSYGTVTWSSGRAAVQCDSGYSSALGSTGSYALTGSYFYAKITPDTASGAETYIQLTASAGNNVSLTCTNGNLQAAITQGGTYNYIGGVTYNATSMAWWRIRELSGVIYFDTSPDGSAWSNQFTTAYTMSLASMSAWLYAGGSSATGSSYIANVNAGGGAPAAALSAAPSLSAEAAGGSTGGLVYMGGYQQAGSNAVAEQWAIAQGLPNANGGFQSVYQWGTGWTGTNSVEQVQVGQAQAMAGYPGPCCLSVGMTQSSSETNLSSALSGSSLTSGCSAAHAATAAACVANGVQYIKMAWEFNGGQNYNWMPPWGSYTAAEFKLLWQLIYGVYSAAAVSAGKPADWFQFIYCMVQADSSGNTDMADFYPGMPYAGYVTIDEYDRSQGSYTGWDEALNDPPGLAESVTFALAQGAIGVGMPEWGIRNDAYGPSVIPDVSYINSAFSWMKATTEQGLNVLAWPWGAGYTGDISDIGGGPGSWNFAAWPTMWSALTSNVATGISQGWIATSNPTAGGGSITHAATATLAAVPVLAVRSGSAVGDSLAMVGLV